MFDKKTIDKFWGCVKKSPDHGGCWVWQGNFTRGGYGQFSVNNKTFRAHRYALMIENGEIPPVVDVHHKCLNRACVNPAHLEPLTHQENMKEAARRGVWTGERNGRAKRTESEVQIIRCLKTVGLSVGTISRKMSIPNRSVYYALTGWSHLKF
jgi:HNH endonuclease